MHTATLMCAHVVPGSRPVCVPCPIPQPGPPAARVGTGDATRKILLGRRRLLDNSGVSEHG